MKKPLPYDNKGLNKYIDHIEKENAKNLSKIKKLEQRIKAYIQVKVNELPF